MKFKDLAKVSVKEAARVLPHLMTRRTAIDVGAYVGTWATQLAPKFNKLFAIEPLASNCVKLKENLSHFSNVEILQYACGDNNSYSEVDVATEVNMMFSGPIIAKHLRHGIKSHKELVNLSRLDSLLDINDPIDFIKIDADGMDLKVLEGARTTIFTHKPPIFIEVKYGKEEIALFLESMGYVFILKQGPNELWAP